MTKLTRQEAQAFIDAVVKMRAAAGDEIALEASAAYPRWRVDTTYLAGDRVLFEDILYKVLQPHTSQETWTPTAAPSLFAKVLIPSPDVIPEWEQPDSTNPYMKGDKVMYNGQIYVSNCDNNVWAPGTYGWDLV